MDAIENLATVKARLSEFVDTVHSTHQRVTITRNGRPAAVLISPEDLESMEETLALLADPGLAAALREAQEDVDAGRLHAAEDVAAEIRERAARERSE